MILEFAAKDIAKYLKFALNQLRIVEDNLYRKFEEYLCKRRD